MLSWPLRSTVHWCAMRSMRLMSCCFATAELRPNHDARHDGTGCDFCPSRRRRVGSARGAIPTGTAHTVCGYGGCNSPGHAPGPQAAVKPGAQQGPTAPPPSAAWAPAPAFWDPHPNFCPPVRCCLPAVTPAVQQWERQGPACQIAVSSEGHCILDSSLSLRSGSSCSGEGVGNRYNASCGASLPYSHGFVLQHSATYT